MKTAELRNKSADELQKQLLELRQGQFNGRFQKSTGNPDADTSKVSKARKTIARIKTLQNEQKSGKAPVAKKATAAKKPAAKKKTKE